MDVISINLYACSLGKGETEGLMEGRKKGRMREDVLNQGKVEVFYKPINVMCEKESAYDLFV